VKRPNEQFLLFRIRVFKDESAFASLLETYGSIIQRFLYFKLPTQHDVEDAYSLVCIRLWEYAITQSVQHVSGLLHTIARGVIAEFYRSREKEMGNLSIGTQEGQIDLAKENESEQLEEFVDTSIMKQGLQELSDDDRDAVIMRYLEGHSVKEIARHLGKTQNATSVLLHRAIKKLREILKKHNKFYG